MPIEIVTPWYKTSEAWVKKDGVWRSGAGQDFVADPSASGRFLTADYGADHGDTGAHWWRAYAFKPLYDITITALIGGLIEYDPAVLSWVALYEGEWSSGNGYIEATAVLASAELHGTERRQELSITPITLDPNNYYLIGMGCMTGDPTMHSVGYWDVAEMIDSLEIFDEWHPAQVDEIYQVYIYRNGDPTHLLNRAPDSGGAIDARPDLGFFWGGYTFEEGHPAIAMLHPKVDGVWKDSEVSIYKKISE